MRFDLRDNLITRNYTVRLFLTSILLTLSSANYAFDNQGFGQTQAMDPFTRRFGNKSAKGTYSLPANFLSYSNSFPFLLLVCGIVIGSVISNQYGRRTTCFLMSIWAMCCVPIIVTSKGRSQFLAGRCLNSVYIGMEMSTIPIFQSEIVPAAVRGLATVSYQLSFGVGALIISGICHRTSTITNDWSWRIPFLCYLFVPFIVASFIWFQPESPRWLASRGRIDAARLSLTKFRKPGHDVEHELEQILLGLELERNLSKGSYASCFQGRHLRRTLIVFAVNFFLQATGQAFTSSYGPLIIKSLNSINPFNYTLITNGLNLAMYILSAFLNDRIGRRPIMIASAGLQAAFLFIIAGLGTAQLNASKQVNAALVAFIILFAQAYTFGWAPLSYLISAETPSQELRDKTARMGFAIGIVTQFAVAFSLPYLLNAPYANLGMKVGFIYAPLATLAFIWAYFFLPELKGLTLEQVDLLFESRVAATQSASWNAEHRALDITADESGRITASHDARKGAIPREDWEGKHHEGVVIA